MFENVFKLLKIKNKNFVHFWHKGGGRGGVHNSLSRIEPSNLSFKEYFCLKNLKYGLFNFS